MSDGTRELLKRSDVFRGLDDAELERVLALASPASFVEGATIVAEDARGGSCYFVLEGRVDVEGQPSFAGREPQRLATIKRGEMFGELTLVDGFLRSATARAHDAVRVLAFENGALEALTPSPWPSSRTTSTGAPSARSSSPPAAGGRRRPLRAAGRGLAERRGSRADA